MGITTRNLCRCLVSGEMETVPTPVPKAAGPSRTLHPPVAELIYWEAANRGPRGKVASRGL